MLTKQNSIAQQTGQKKIYTFKQEYGRWYIYLPDYLEQGWSKQDLELTEGAHKVLNILSNGAKKLCLHLSLEAFDGANVLELKEHCPAPKGGGIYFFNLERQCNSNMYWISDLALFIFGDIPERIYLKRLVL